MHSFTAKTLEDIRTVSGLNDEPVWQYARDFLAKAPAEPGERHLRWLEDNGEVIACVQFFPHKYLIGAAKMGMGLPEYPFVHPDKRGQGYFKALMADLFDFMRRSGYSLALDHGVKGLYTGQGYAPGFHHSIALIRVADAETVPESLPVRHSPTSKEVDELLSRFGRPIPLGRGFLCRDENWRPKPEDVWFVRDNISKEVAGFFNLGGVENGKLRITEAAASNPFAAASLLRAAAVEARKRGVDLIYVNSYSDDRFARMCLLAGGEIRHCAGQVRSYSDEPEDEDCIYLVDVVLCFQQLLPELERRLKNFSGKLPEAICIKMEDEVITLTLTPSIEVHEGKIESAPICQFSRPALTQAVMGYASALEVVARYPNCDVPSAVRSIISALLPARDPHQEYEPWGFASVKDFGLIP